jgi:hypothetical protein
MLSGYLSLYLELADFLCSGAMHPNGAQKYTPKVIRKKDWSCEGPFPETCF